VSQATDAPSPSEAVPPHLQDEDWETWLGVFGLVVTILLIAMIFDFVTVQFDVSRGNFSMLWMFGIVWGLGLAIGLGEVAIRKRVRQKPINWGRALLLYVITSLGYTLFYLMVHRWQLRPRNVPATDPAQAAPDTIRAEFGTSVEENAVHGSDAPETAADHRWPPTPPVAAASVCPTPSKS